MGTAHFAIAWGNGKPDYKNGESKDSREYKAGKAAVKDILQYGELCRTRAGELYFTSQTLPWKLVPLLENDRRMMALIDHIYRINRASTRTYALITASLQNEAYVNGKVIEVHQFSHSDFSTKTAYLSLCDGQTMLKLTGTDEDTWDRLPEVPNGTDGVYFIDDPEWEPWRPVFTSYADTDPKTGQEYDRHEYDRGVARKMLVDSIPNFSENGLTVEEQHWLLDKTLTALLLNTPEKPALLFVGDNGAGKSFLGEALKGVMFGKASATAENIKDSESLRVTMTTSPLVVVDNLDEHGKDAKWLVKDLSIACTGGTIPLRKLYTTNEKVVLQPRSWVIGTSTNTKFLSHSPAMADRSVIFHLRRLKEEEFKSRRKLMQPILDKRDAIMTDLALRLNDYVGAWRARDLDGHMRMGEYAETILLMARQDKEEAKAKQIFKKLQSKQNATISDNHWLMDAIERITANGNGTMKVSGVELLALAKEEGYSHLTVNTIHSEIVSMERVIRERYEMDITFPGNRKTYNFKPKKPKGQAN